MDTHPDDLNEMERRLSAWKPTPDGLDADAMLFAAGVAAGRPGAGRWFWPALSGCLSVLVVVLSGWGMTERRERLLLARQLPPAPVPAAPNPAPPEPRTTDGEVQPNSFLAAHRAVEQGLDEWPAGAVPAESTDPLPLELPILRVGQRNALVDQ
jgi:hypothetical protein